MPPLDAIDTAARFLVARVVKPLISSTMDTSPTR
jgi:hypothetical protein